MSPVPWRESSGALPESPSPPTLGDTERGHLVHGRGLFSPEYLGPGDKGPPKWGLVDCLPGPGKTGPFHPPPDHLPGLTYKHHVQVAPLESRLFKVEETVKSLGLSLASSFMDNPCDPRQVTQCL